jgi:hypothetical protein
MATYTLSQNSVGVVQAASGVLQTIKCTTPPTPSYELPEGDPTRGVWVKGYLSLVDSSVTPHRPLFVVDQQFNAVVVPAQATTPAPAPVPVGASFTQLSLTAIPQGSTYVITTTP